MLWTQAGESIPLFKGVKVEGDNSRKKKYKQLICIWGKKMFHHVPNHRNAR